MTPVRRQLRSATGLTLVELLVTMAILAAVLTALAASVVSTQRASYQVEGMTDNVARSRVSIEVLSRALRAAGPPPDNAPAFHVADARHAQFTTYLGEGDAPSLVEFRVTSDGRLIESVTEPEVVGAAITWPTTNRRERALTHGVGPGRIFSYTVLDEDGDETRPTGPLSRPQRRQVHRVDITLSVGGRTDARVPRQTLTTTVRLPNRSGS